MFLYIRACSIFRFLVDIRVSSELSQIRGKIRQTSVHEPQQIRRNRRQSPLYTTGHRLSVPYSQDPSTLVYLYASIRVLSGSVLRGMP